MYITNKQSVEPLDIFFYHIYNIIIFGPNLDYKLHNNLKITCKL